MEEGLEVVGGVVRDGRGRGRAVERGGKGGEGRGGRGRVESFERVGRVGFLDG